MEPGACFVCKATPIHSAHLYGEPDLPDGCGVCHPCYDRSRYQYERRLLLANGNNGRRVLNRAPLNTVCFAHNDDIDLDQCPTVNGNRDGVKSWNSFGNHWLCELCSQRNKKHRKRKYNPWTGPGVPPMTQNRLKKLRKKRGLE